MIDKFTVVDGHVHTFSTEEIALRIIESFNKLYDIAFENPGSGSIQDVLTNMGRIGIDYTVMANFAPPKILHENNKWAVSVSKNHKCLVPLVSFHPEMEGCLGSLLEQYIKDGAKGLKIHPMAQGFDPGDRRLDDVYRICDEVSLPIEFHCGRVANARLNAYADLDMLLPVIDKYRGIPVILTHMADGNVKDVLSISKKYSNVYFDTSIVITGYPPIMNTNEPSWLDDGTVEDIVNEIGADRVLFGSDYPWGSPGHDLKRIISLKLSDNQKELILGKNAEKLFEI